MLLSDGEPEAAEGALTAAGGSGSGVISGYAGHLRGHILIGREDLDPAADLLEAAASTMNA
ncbi:hypothetical protein [Nonomuraea longicatena]|uniref:hypothetical protein n=1 Tax=Nonomuraea longicatena TaxID=83682 RepID=UPI0031DF9DEA